MKVTMVTTGVLALLLLFLASYGLHWTPRGRVVTT